MVAAGRDLAELAHVDGAAGVADFDDSRTIVFGTSTDAVEAALAGEAWRSPISRWWRATFRKAN